jgi:hypothetical protein
MTFPRDTDLETPIEDAAEQATSAVPDRIEDEDENERTPDDGRAVELDDEYR